MPEQNLDNKDKELENSPQNNQLNEELAKQLAAFEAKLDAKLGERDGKLQKDFEGYKKYMNDDNKTLRQKLDKLDKFDVLLDGLTKKEDDSEKKKSEPKQEVNKDELLAQFRETERKRKKILQADFYDQITDLRGGVIRDKDKVFFASNWDEETYDDKLKAYIASVEKDIKSTDEDEEEEKLNVKKSPNQPNPNNSKLSKNELEEISKARSILVSNSGTPAQREEARKLLDKYQPIYR